MVVTTQPHFRGVIGPRTKFLDQGANLQSLPTSPLVTWEVASLPSDVTTTGKVWSLSSGTFSKRGTVRGQMGVTVLWSLGWMTWLGSCSIPTGLGSEWHLAVSTSHRLSEVRAELLWRSHHGLCPQAAPEGSTVDIPAGPGLQRVASARAWTSGRQTH